MSVFWAAPVCRSCAPTPSIEVGQPGGYNTLLEHMAVPAFMLSQQTGRPVAWDEAVSLWYDDVYLPVVRAIRSSQPDLLRRYPGRSEADLYLWLMEHRDALAQEPDLEPALAAAARQFVEAMGSPRLRWLAETRSEPGAWRMRRVLPRGDGTAVRRRFAVAGRNGGGLAGGR